MPTSTATMTVAPQYKVSKLPVSTKKLAKNAITTLRSLYNRAAKAFLQRDVALTHSLLLSAFLNLHAPATHLPDAFSSHRRKWDILRITLETTLYASGTMSTAVPEALQPLLMLSPQSLIATMHTRSLQLFTPANRNKPSAEFLPSQILITLVLASVKLDCPQMGREMIEDWLGHRNQTVYDAFKDSKQLAEEAEGYERILEVYCLHVLPRLDDWDYAREFLRYESELPEDRRMSLVQSLQLIHSEHVFSLEKGRDRLRSHPSPSSSRTPTPRPPTATVTPATPERSPSPSLSIASSSTASTHTAVPLHRPNGVPSGLTSITPTPRAQTPAQLSSSARTDTARQPRSRGTSPLFVQPSASQVSISTISAPSLLSLLKTSLIPHLSKSKLSFLIIMCLVSLVSFIFRVRRRKIRLSRAKESAQMMTSSAGEKARRKLYPGWWAEIRKAVVDTVKMAGSGLV